jgi:hypothetical protein
LKRLIALLILGLVVASLSFAQSNNLNKTIGTYEYYSRDTLTASVDTEDISTGQAGIAFKRWVIQAYNPTGADTVNVYIKSRDGQFWMPVAVTNTATGATATAIPTTTVGIECIIQSSEVFNVRLVSTSNDASTTVFVVAGKSY